MDHFTLLYGIVDVVSIENFRPGSCVAPNNISVHLQDLSALCIRDSLVNLGIIVDHGVDWDWRGSMINFAMYGEFFLNHKLDIFVVTAYAPKALEYNPIEHAWGYLTNELVGITLDDVSSSNPVCCFHFVTQQKTPDALHMALDDGAKKIANSWQQRTFNGHVIEVTVPTCKKSLEPHPDIDLWDSFFNAPVSEKKAECWKTLREKLTLLMKHCDKRGRF